MPSCPASQLAPAPNKPCLGSATNAVEWPWHSTSVQQPTGRGAEVMVKGSATAELSAKSHGTIATQEHTCNFFSKMETLGVEKHLVNKKHCVWPLGHF